MNLKSIITIILLLYCRYLAAQEDKTARDSAIIIQDSLIYNSIDEASGVNPDDSAKYLNFETMSGRTKFGRMLHRFLFRRLEKEKRPAFSLVQLNEARNHKLGQGKTIRKINILSFDPFGYNIRDTSIHPSKTIFRIGNSLHAKTNAPVIRNLLMFRENDLYDSTIVKESERLIRSQEYIRDVYLDVTPVKRDSVDVTFRVIDVWSLLPSGVKTGSETVIGIRDLNFAGTGSSFEVTSSWKHDKGNVTHLSYLMPNIHNTYTSLNIQYLFSPGGKLLEIHDFDNYFYSPVSIKPQYLFSANPNIIRSVELNRPFYSPLVKWAGGIFLGQIMNTQTYMSFDTIHFLSDRMNVLDLWAGRSWRIFRNNRDERVTSLVLSGRYISTASPSRKKEAIDFDIFNNHSYLFGALSITSRKYFRDRYIFNYGKTEDVPAGKIAGFTIGRDYQQKSRLYFGLNAGTGTYYSFGYLSTHLAYGTFADLTGFHQGILTGRITYFTRLLTIGNWRLRQFVQPGFVFGIKRSPIENQPLKVGIKGFESIESLASNVIVISLQTQSYAPWNLAGFHFGPYMFSHIGILGEQPIGHSGRVYSLFGLGLLIKNDYLMFNTFQVSLSFYPYIPENRYNLFRANAYKTTDYRFRDFEVSKPGIAE